MSTKGKDSSIARSLLQCELPKKTVRRPKLRQKLEILLQARVKVKEIASLLGGRSERTIRKEIKRGNAALRNPKNCTEHDTAECEGLPKWKSNASSPLPYRI